MGLIPTTGSFQSQILLCAHRRTLVYRNIVTPRVQCMQVYGTPWLKFWIMGAATEVNKILLGLCQINPLSCMIFLRTENMKDCGCICI